MLRTLGLLALFLVVVACNKGGKLNSPVLAEVGSNKLYLSDINSYIPPNIGNQKDSVAYINQEIESWVREQLILEKVSLSDKDQNEIKPLVQAYKHNLERARFEENWLEEHIDTNFEQIVIDSFVAANQFLFEEEGEWIKCNFAKINGNVSELTAFEKDWSTEKIAKVSAFCDKFADLKHLDKNIWITKSSIENLVPKGAFKDGTFDIKGYTQRSYKGYEYFLTIYKLKTGSSLPKELKNKNARTILLQEQKLRLLKEYRENLYQNALKEKRIRYYLDKVI